MSFRRGVIWTLVVGAALAGLAPEAEARRGGRDRLRERIPLVAADGSPVQARQARLRLERRSDRQELRVQIEGAPTGLALDVWMEDGTGAVALVGAMREDDPGEYVWRVRTKKGDALPFGVSDLSELSGRKVEVRTAAGQTVFTAAIPTLPAAAARSFAKRPLRTGLAVDGAVAGSVGALGSKAKVEVRRKRNGDEKFEVELDDAPAGLSLELWMEDATGAMVLVGAMTAESDDDEGGDDRSSGTSGDDDSGEEGESDDDGSDDASGDDDGDDDDGDGDTDDDDWEYTYEVETEDGDVLPLGAASVSDLAGLRVEVRTTSGEVLASGTVPALADLSGDDDEDDGSLDG